MSDENWKPTAAETQASDIPAQPASPMPKAPMRGKAKGIIVTLAAIAAAIIVVLAATGAFSADMDNSGSDNSQEKKDGAEYIADFDATVYDEYGDARTITALADGKPLVMNFWATWCPYCVEEMTDYQEIYDEYGDRVSFAFIDIADGTRDTVDGASSWLYENGFSLPAYYDTNLEAMYAYGATALPTTVIAAADGEILRIAPGRIDADELRETLDSLVEG